MKDFEQHNPSMFTGGYDVMIVKDWLQSVDRIFTIIGLKDDAIRINVASF